MLNLENDFLKLNLLDYIYNNQLIEDEKYGLILHIKKTFQNTRDFKTTSFIDNLKTEGGKSIDRVEEFYLNNHQYIKLQRIMAFNSDFLENTLFTEKQTFCYYKNNKDFHDFILQVCELIDKVYLIFYGDNYQYKIKLLTEKIKKIGINKIAKQLKMSKNTIYNICSGDKNYRYILYEKLCNYVGLAI